MNDTVKRIMGLVDDVIAASQTLSAENKCNPHPKAPHGFDRNSSHSAHRYVCECESWDAYDAGFNAGFQSALSQEALAEPAVEPMPSEQITDHIRSIDIDLCSFSFRSGVRWAEKQHGISWAPG